MLITTLASMVAAMLFLLAMIYVTISDLRTRRIPNWLVIVLGLAYLPLAWIAGHSAPDIAINIGVGAVVFAVGVFLFARGWIGGGDVKLAAVSVMWLGAGLALPYVLLTSIFGAGFALAGLLGLHLLARKGRGESRPVDGKMPYAPGMACAGLLLLQISPWAEAL